MPYVMRPAAEGNAPPDNEFRSFGYACIHGIMDGEVFETEGLGGLNRRIRVGVIGGGRSFRPSN